MNCYLMRHGDAVAVAQSHGRPLSLHGRHRVKQVGQAALERGTRVSRIYHSGILRAQETAAIMSEYLNPTSGLAALMGLAPDDDPMIARAALETAEEPILLVSHLPLLSRLAATLLHGNPEPPVVEFLPGTLLCCHRSAGRWEIAWRIAN